LVDDIAEPRPDIRRGGLAAVDGKGIAAAGCAEVARLRELDAPAGKITEFDRAPVKRHGGTGGAAADDRVAGIDDEVERRSAHPDRPRRRRDRIGAVVALAGHEAEGAAQRVDGEAPGRAAA